MIDMSLARLYSERTGQAVFEYIVNSKDSIVAERLKAYQSVDTKITHLVVIK